MEPAKIKCGNKLSEHLMTMVSCSRHRFSRLLTLALSPFHSHSLLLQIYNRAVTEPTRLNRYKGWSAEVYGEFTNKLISSIIGKVPIRPTDRFIDLGSGR